MLPLTESSFSTLQGFENCSGGNSRLSYLFGVGGGHFLIKNSRGKSRSSHPVLNRTDKPHRGIQPRRGLGLRMRRAIAATSPVARAPFGVLFRFQIPNFNPFWFLFYLPCSLSCLVRLAYQHRISKNCSGEEQPPSTPDRVWGAIIF